MTTFLEWINKMIELIVPSPQSNAWDQYKRSRLIEAEAVKQEPKGEVLTSRFTRLREI